MISELKPYPAYKGSGLPWLGEVPDHWEVRSLGSITSAIAKRGRPDLPLLSVVREKGVIPRASMSDDENHNYVPDDLANYKVVRAGNLVINKMKAWQGSLGVAPVDGIVSPAYFVFDFKTENRSYGQALLRSKTYVGFFAQASDGVRIGQWDLSIDGMKRIPVVVPPPPEQTAIVRFLDHTNRRIQRYIRAKQKLIQLLEEQKQAIINRAVNRGLDPKVRLKPSGIELLGDVPGHWEIKPLKRWAQMNACTLPEKTDLGYTFRYVDIGTVGTGRLVRNPEVMTLKGAPSRARRIVRNGDTLISTVRTYLRAIYFVEEAGEDLIASTGFAALSPSRQILPRYLSFLIQSASFIDRVAAHSVGTAYPAISESKMGAFHLAVPPRIEEQKKILQHLDYEAAPFESALKKAYGEITFLREYRTRLIADVVTGKLDVREAAAGLPDESEQPEPLEDKETMVDADEDDENTAVAAAPEEIKE